MSEIRLGNIQSTSPAQSSTFILGDVVEGGGTVDPFLVRDMRTLYENFRYAPRYRDYVALLQAGCSLYLVGSAQDFQRSTLVLYNQNIDELGTNPYNRTRILYANPTYEELYLKLEEIITKLRRDALFSLDSYVGFIKEFPDFSYQYELSLNKDASAEDLKADLLEHTYDSVNQKYLFRSLYIPLVPTTYESLQDSIRFIRAVIYDSSVLEGWIDNDDYIRNDKWISNNYFSYHDVPIGYYPEEQDWLMVEETMYMGHDFSGMTNEDIIKFYLITYRDLIAKLNVGLKTEIDDNKIKIQYSSPLYCPDWVTGRFDNLYYEGGQQFTNLVYHYRGYKNQDYILALASRLFGKESHDLKLRIAAGLDLINEMPETDITLEFKFLNETYYYTGSIYGSDRTLPSILEQSPLVEFIDSNTPKDSVYLEDSWYSFMEYANKRVDLNSLIKSYDNILDYQAWSSVILTPENLITRFSSYPKFQVLIDKIKLLSDKKSKKGFTSTLLVDADECYEINRNGSNAKLDYLKSLFNDDFYHYFFSGGIDGYHSRILYILKWLTSKAFTPDNKGDWHLYRIPNTLYVDFDGINLVYDDDPDLQVALTLSNANNLIFDAIIVGDSRSQIANKLNNAISVAKEFNPLIQSMVIDSIEQEGNTLNIIITTKYRRLNKVILTNFKLIK